MSATFVTTLFDLQPYQSTPRPRDITAYLDLAAPLLRVAVPMVIVTEPALLPYVANQRKGCAETMILVNELPAVVPGSAESHHRDSSLDALCASFAEAYERPEFMGNRAKDTPAYMALQHAKFDFMALVARANAFGAGSVCWIDAGILHVNPEAQEASLAKMVRIAESCPEDHACIAMAFPDHPAPLYGYRQFHGRTPGGLFSWPVRDAETWCKALKIEAKKGLERGGYPYECDVLYEVAFGRFKIDAPRPLPLMSFDPAAGYKEILSNFPN